MNYPQLLSIIGTIPLFSMRTFFPAFLTALFFAHPELFPGVSGVPDAVEGGSFLAQNWLIIVLGVLSILEFTADKNNDIKVFLREAEPYLKPVSYLIIQLFVLGDQSEEVLNQINWAGFNPMIILAIIGSGAVYLLSLTRKNTLNFLYDIDADDNLFLGRIISWCEDSLVFFGFLLLIWAGIFMIILYAIIIGLIILIRKQYIKSSEQQKYTCNQCSHKNLPYACKCSNCGAENPEIFSIGILGQKKNKKTDDILQHRFNLLAQGRCPACATRQENISKSNTCNECGTMFFESPSKQDFIKFLDKRYYLIMSISILIGFVPIIGFVVSASLVSIYLLAPYRRYISKKGAILSKLLIRFLTVLFFIFGSALGFIAAPIYATIRYFVVRSQFKAIKHTSTSISNINDYQNHKS